MTHFHSRVKNPNDPGKPLLIEMKALSAPGPQALSAPLGGRRGLGEVGAG